MLIMVDAAHISAVIHQQQHNNEMMRLVLRGNRNRAATIFLRKKMFSLRLPLELNENSAAFCEICKGSSISSVILIPRSQNIAYVR